MEQHSALHVRAIDSRDRSGACETSRHATDRLVAKLLHCDITGAQVRREHTTPTPVVPLPRPVLSALQEPTATLLAQPACQLAPLVPRVPTRTRPGRSPVIRARRVRSVPGAGSRRLTIARHVRRGSHGETFRNCCF